MSLRSVISRNLINVPGSKVPRKIVIFESDDWGAIRCPDKDDYCKYLKFFGPDFKSPFLRYDTLASEDDLTLLFELLGNHKDSRGKPAQITFNTIIANPDFDKIRESDYRSYFWEPFTTTLSRYSEHTKAFSLWQQAIDEGLMHPQFHGREHVNVPQWMNRLQNNDLNLLKAFEYRTWSVPRSLYNGQISLQASMDYEYDRPSNYIESFIKEGLDEFSNIFGFRSHSFIPPNFVIDAESKEYAVENGIKIFQGMKYQISPKGKRVIGEKPKIQRYFNLNNRPLDLVRNCGFEPTLNGNPRREMRICLKQISNAFLWKKPAIITSHRVNFIGRINAKNRDQNLHYLDTLLSKILDRWPDVRFGNSLTNLV